MPNRKVLMGTLLAIVFVALTLSACTAGQTAESAVVATEVPAVTVAPTAAPTATPTPEPTPEPTPTPVPESVPLSYTVTLPAEKKDDAAKLSDGNANTRISVKTDRMLGFSWEGEAQYLYLNWYAVPANGYTVAQYDASGNELAREFVQNVIFNQVLDINTNTVRLELLPGTGESCSYGTESDLTDETRSALEDGFVLSDCYLYSVGVLPDTVQRFETYSSAPEIVVAVSRPGEEYIDYGGLLPLLADQGSDVMLIIAEEQTAQQRNESLQAFWSLGFRRQPVILGLVSRGGTDYGQLKKKNEWDTAALTLSLETCLKEQCPSVLFCYGNDAETENGAHRLMGYLWGKAIEKTHKSATLPTCVCCLNETEKANAVSLDFSSSLSSFGGKTATEVANDCLRTYSGSIALSGQTANIPSFILDYPSEGDEEKAKEIALISSFTAFTADAEIASTGTDSSVADTSKTASSSVVDDKWAEYFRSADDPAEVVISDSENSHYEYRSDTLSVIIDGYYIEDPYNTVEWVKDVVETEADEVPWVYYVAHIRMRDNEYHSGFANNTHNGGDPRQLPYKVARQEHAVLFLTGDNLVHAEKEKKGILIRDGYLYSDADASDTLAFYPDLSLRVYHQGTITAKELLEDGVLSTYGMMYCPILVEDGEICENINNSAIFGRNPRCAIGMVEPGHYVAIVTEGRRNEYKAGLLLSELAQMFVNEGCTVAYNLDGGISASMVFMGEQLNTHRGGSKKDSKYQRNVPEGLCFGYSNLVPGVNDPVTNTGNATVVR